MPDQNVNLVMLVAGTTMVILSLAGFIIAMLHVYQKKQFAFQNNIEKIKREHEKDLLQTQLQIQEQTLENISRDIHDNIALGLTLSKLNLNMLEYPDCIRDKIEFSVGLISEAIQNLGNISKSLNADTIRKCGLFRSVETEIGNLERTGQYRVMYEIAGDVRCLDIKTELVIYRILQESFNNIVKHANASEIAVTLSYLPLGFEMIVRDNGIGFSFSQLRHSRSLMGSGLNNMQQRAKTVGADCAIVSKVGEGTMIRLTVHQLENENKEKYG